MSRLLHASVALALAAALVALAGVPVCLSSACPMSPAQRAACKAMGGDCCEAKGGQVAHAPALSAPVLAPAPAGLSLASPGTPETAAFAELSRRVVPPAVLQGVGLFTFLAVFLI